MDLKLNFSQPFFVSSKSQKDEVLLWFDQGKGEVSIVSQDQMVPFPTNFGITKALPRQMNKADFLQAE